MKRPGRQQRPDLPRGIAGIQEDRDQRRGVDDQRAGHLRSAARSASTASRSSEDRVTA